MEKQRLSEKIIMVINTLNGVTLRVDQKDAIQRINATVEFLQNLIPEADALQAKETKEE